jgi:hypothetical protein
MNAYTITVGIILPVYLPVHLVYKMYADNKVKDKAIPLQAWTGPGGSGGLGPQISRQSAHEGGKVVSPTHRPPLPPGNIPGTHFC